MEWKTLTKQQKLARLKTQLEQIKQAQTLLDEFARLTNAWTEKVKSISDSQNKAV